MAKGKRKRRRGGGGGKKKSGFLIGMRSGFKNVATSVTGVGEDKPAKSRTSQMVSTAITVILVLAAAALLYRRFG